MSMLRRFISLCLVLAFASYGTAMAAAAHAHGANDGERFAVHAIAVDATWHAEGHDHAEGLGVDPDQNSHERHQPGEEPAHGGFHVHAVSVFTTADEPVQVSQPATATVMSWIERPIGNASGLFSPLKKPPRIFL
jgi:hypothetical protein